MIFLSLEEWQKKEGDYLFDKNPIIECPSCNGEGIVEDECSCCGHETEEECDDCCGNGKLEFNEFARSEVLTKEKYLAAIQNEFSLLASFTNKNEAELYFNNGFIAWCSISTKNILIRQ